MIRSARYDVDNRMRYSYVQPDGETYDISELLEQEWRESHNVSPAAQSDLLEGVLVKNKDGLGATKLERVLNKIKNGKVNAQQSDSISTTEEFVRSTSPSAYSIDESSSGTARTPTPLAAVQRTTSPMSTLPRAISPASTVRPRTTTPTVSSKPISDANRRQPSIASVMSDQSGYATPTGRTSTPPLSPREVQMASPRRQLVVPKDDFGIPQMMSIIELRGSAPKKPQRPVHPVDELLFGTKMDVESLHPQIQQIYAGSFQQLIDMDKALNDFLEGSVKSF